MGFGQKLKEAFGHKNGANPGAAAMQAAGTTVVSFSTFTSRIYSQEEFRRELKRKPDDTDATTAILRFEWYVKQWHKVFDMFKTNQVAFGRAGDKQAYGRMFFAVDGIAKEIEVAIVSNRSMLIADELKIKEAEKNQSKDKEHLILQQQQLVTDFVVAYLELAGYLYIEMTSDACWFDKDVSTPQTIAIQSNQPIQQMYPATTNEHPKDYAPPTQKQNWGKPKNLTEQTEPKE